MNKKIFLSAASILTALALIAGATYAYFSDVGTSSNNVFASGTFDLKLTDDNQTALDNVSETWTGTNMAPGGTAVTADLKFKNSGTVAGDHVHIKATNTPTDNGDAEDLGPMAKHLQITAITYDGNPVTVPDTNGNGHADLQDLDVAAPGIKLGSLTDLNTDHTLHMSVQLDSDADNTYQGDQVVTVFTATLDQNASQTP